MEGGEGELGLRFDTVRAQYPDVGRLRDRVLEQSGLTDAGLAPDHQGAATRGSRGGDQTVDRRAFCLSTEQHV